MQQISEQSVLLHITLLTVQVCRDSGPSYLSLGSLVRIPSGCPVFPARGSNLLCNGGVPRSFPARETILHCLHLCFPGIDCGLIVGMGRAGRNISKPNVGVGNNGQSCSIGLASIDSLGNRCTGCVRNPAREKILREPDAQHRIDPGILLGLFPRFLPTQIGRSSSQSCDLPYFVQLKVPPLLQISSTPPKHPRRNSRNAPLFCGDFSKPASVQSTSVRTLSSD